MYSCPLAVADWKIKLIKGGEILRNKMVLLFLSSLRNDLEASPRRLLMLKKFWELTSLVVILFLADEVLSYKGKRRKERFLPSSFNLPWNCSCRRTLSKHKRTPPLQHSKQTIKENETNAYTHRYTTCTLTCVRSIPCKPSPAVSSLCEDGVRFWYCAFSPCKTHPLGGHLHTVVSARCLGGRLN